MSSPTAPPRAGPIAPRLAECTHWLLAGVRRGEPQAGNAFVQAHGEMAYRLAYARLRHQQDAEDVAADTLTNLLCVARSGTIHPQHDAPWAEAGYVRQSVLRACAAFSRKACRRAAILTLADDLSAAQAPPEPNADIDTERLWQCLARLTEGLFAVIDCRVFRRKSVPHTARELGVAEGTVKSRTHRVLRELAECLSRGDQDQPGTTP